MLRNTYLENVKRYVGNLSVGELVRIDLQAFSVSRVGRKIPYK